MKFLCFDVGGTVIKAAIVTDLKVGKISSFPAKSNCEKEDILENFCSIIDSLITSIDTLDGLYFAFPGNFDYENGICLISGIDKYDSIYNFNLKEFFYNYITTSYQDKIMSSFKIKFINDVSAAALGSTKIYQEASTGKAVVLCIGTGCGSAFMADGKIVTSGAGVPENGWVFPLALLGETYDSLLSVRGFKKLAEKICGNSMDGLEALERYKADDENAKKLFCAFGSNIAMGIEQIIKAFHPNTIILGGGIVKSYNLFCEPIENIAIQHQTKIITAEDTTKLALLGLI